MTRAVVAGVAALAVLLPATAAFADNLPNLPQNANGYEQSFSPAYDYDTDGCYAVAAISPTGTLNPGLNPTGALNGNCRDQSDLDRTQTYSRSKCNNGWCAIVYASYFEKDQAIPGLSIGGHRHDWEHVISWVNQATNQVEYVTTTQHSSQVTYPRSQVRFDGTHPKTVYHKDGISTHYFRLANSNDEPPENHYHTWRYPPIVGWDGWPSTALRDTMTTADFGSATQKISAGRFESLLSASKPAGIPFDPGA
ncbi:NPP1 family protein [Dactylosporangium vinaceum]|uniref:NPP1 family protein n=1 Tax=Dactylosporangium vinaceum TaxID=53362 RepID=A0ABV5MEA2_9ACTN|nr:NPP1 family protein [Dactylosporangium vinaceum]UAB92468.1 NPP1 family protein [Dactylosporangium vinaceum]